MIIVVSSGAVVVELRDGAAAADPIKGAIASWTNVTNSSGENAAEAAPVTCSLT
eukprot:CAMPEP_0176465358 /NCGR_PEP_ID=MMETSP0127-20121128/37184_1 /TAXON_ID=938130 /ORGANISM="Platyophrya macrostoma, Strain WH" /LENGTH=53 /DNA_ID=CAMNT_0017858189 /DNA_START=58 /DNA_END=215 /DNA_ORIENTATION=-